MEQSLVFEDVKVNTEIPSINLGPITTQDLIQWAAASGDYHPIHYDKDFALAQGLPSVVIPGPLKLSLLATMVVRWIGPQGRLKRLECTYQALDMCGDTLTCAGRAVGKFISSGGDKYVDCEIWVKNQRGEKTTSGSARVTLG